ncbi:hypothetical protein P4601_00940, partial [Peribacillus frigoritolerans]|uniref:hypothetical protein n=1 Tax=Peribacillus frigoritolerans TaxID=450367 RepID=UPI002E1B7FFE|nr:hypothetical protein [Peribacillus frigoritolerans]
REKRGQWRPRRRAPRRLPDRPRKASAWSVNHYTYPLSEIRSLSADFLPIHIKASVSGVLVSQIFGRSVVNLFHQCEL